MISLLSRDIRNYTGTFVKKYFYSTVASNIQNTEVKDSENTAEPSSFQSTEKSNDQNTSKNVSRLSEFRFIYPEFLPDPKYEFRNKIREKLERSDMLKRRKVLYIPEFYVGSILAVTTSDQYAPGKTKKFVGICIHRTYFALRATFTLRNIVDNQGVEIMYDLYNPTIVFIEVLRLEKRLDEELFYLRDADPKYSTFPFDMEPEFHPEGQPVRINTIKVKLNPPPWYVKWEQRNMNGIESTDAVDIKKRWLAKRIAQPWQKYDLMKEYRRCIPEEDQAEIWQDVDAHKDQFPTRSHVWKRNLQKAPRKVAK